LLGFPHFSRGGAVAARQAHNLEVVGSNPTPGTPSTPTPSLQLVTSPAFEQVTEKTPSLLIAWLGGVTRGASLRVCHPVVRPSLPPPPCSAGGLVRRQLQSAPVPGSRDGAMVAPNFHPAIACPM